MSVPTKLSDLPAHPHISPVDGDLIYVVNSAGDSVKAVWPSPPPPPPAVERIEFTGTDPTVQPSADTKVVYATESGLVGTPTLELPGSQDGERMVVINEVNTLVNITAAAPYTLLGSPVGLAGGDTAEFVFLIDEERWWRLY